MKGPMGKAVSGVYGNPRFIHTAATLVGCVVNIQVRNGTMYEGVFRTLSDKVDLVLEMVYKVEKKSPSITAMLTSKFDLSLVTPKMIFPIGDVISISAVNIDLEFATRDSFTDTAISRFNGQVQERVLEPWDGGVATTDDLTDLGGDEVSNGWAADEMFKTNEVKYGVKSSFDDDLHDYTIPLRKQNTEEYKLNEEKACKIAQEIENSGHYKNRIALENGDEEDRFSAVVRTDPSTSNTAMNSNNNNRFVPHRPRKPQGVRPVRSSPSPNAYPPSRMPHPHLQNYHSKPSSQNMPPVAPQPKVTNGNKQVAMSAQPLPQRQGLSPQCVASNSSPATNVSAAATTQNNAESNKINGDIARSSKEAIIKENNNLEPSLPPPKDVPEKKHAPKVHDEKTEDLKRFHHKFKLPENKDPKCDKEIQVAKASGESSESGSEASLLQEKKSTCDKDSDYGEENDSTESKNSTLNPLAKEFIFNPHAKSFTPRGQQQQQQQQPHQLHTGPPPQQQPPTAQQMPGNLAPPLPPVAQVQPSPRLHAQSPVIAVPQTHIVPGMAHPMFNVAPHYVLPATPVSMPIAPPYTPATSMAQAPRYRKAMPMTLPRNDSSQSIHVQAATGQPILAPPTLSTPQFAIQYAPSPAGILHPAGPQPQIPYAQATFSLKDYFQLDLVDNLEKWKMYSMVGQRVITPQLGIVPAGTYGESPHVPTQLYMNHQNMAHPGQSANSGQHSTPSTPQSQTPNLHTAPSPVHQAPPPPPHGQAPTPTGHPSNPPTPQVVYHGQLVAQHPLHINAASSNHNHPYPMYGTGPQPIMILPQQPMPGPHPHHPATFSAIQNHFHAQTSGAHVATPTQLIPHPSTVTMMQTSTAMAVSNSHHYVPHSQGAWRKASIS